MAGTGMRPTSAATGEAVRFRAEAFDALMADRGLTTAVAKAKAVGVSRMTLHRWVEGATTPSVRDALRVANRLGVPVEALFEFAQ